MDKKNIFYNKEWCTIYVEEDCEAICLHWKGFASYENFKEACDQSLQLLIDKGYSKMIADNRESKVVTPESQKWLLEDWFPRAYQEGYRASAVVVSENIFNQITVKHIVNQMDLGKFSVQYFNKYEDAMHWLKTL